MTEFVRVDMGKVILFREFSKPPRQTVRVHGFTVVFDENIPTIDPAVPV